MGKRSK